MQIPTEYLAEKNYEGTRLILIEDEKIAELQHQLTDLQLEANPTLEEMEKLTPVLDPFYQKIGEHQRAIDEIKKEMAAPKDEYAKHLAVVEEIDQRAMLIKNKIVPIVNEIVAPQLGEFEKAAQLKEEGGKLYVEVVDEVEEKIKAIRASKANK